MNKPYIKFLPKNINAYEFESNFEKLNLYYSYDDYVNYMNRYISEENFLSGEKSIVLEKIFKDAKNLNEVLKPLYFLGVKFNLDICGGSVRDFVLNRHDKIKDLDFLISFETDWIERGNSRYQDIDKKITKEMLLDVGFSEENIKNVGFKEQISYDLNDGLIINQLIELCILKENLNMQKYLNSKKRVSYTKSSRYEKVIKEDGTMLAGVFKVDGLGDFPIDILITHRKRNEFIDHFDYNFCKASFCLINQDLGKVFPRSKEQFIGRFGCDFSFFADVKNKKMTVEANLKSKSSIEKSAKRYDSLKEKYPDFEINIVNNKNKVENGHVELLRQKIFDRIIENKEEIKVKKLKI